MAKNVNIQYTVTVFITFVALRLKLENIKCIFVVIMTLARV